MATPDKKPEGGWPFEKKLERAKSSPADSELAQLVQSGAKMREPMPLVVLEAHMADKNLELKKLEEPELMRTEAIAARLYTGPLFVKYNGVLRGLDSEARACLTPATPRVYASALLTSAP